MQYNNSNARKGNNGFGQQHNNRNGGHKGKHNNRNNQNSNFFNCHLNAVGYINSLREHEGPNGTFLVAQFCALEGRSDAPSHRYFNLTLTQGMSDLLGQLWDEINSEQKCFANVRIGNMEFTPFAYPADHKYSGQLGVNCTGRLLSVQSLSINKQRIDLDQFGASQQSGYQQSRPQQNGNGQTPQHHGQGHNQHAQDEYFDEMMEEQHWQEDAQAPSYQQAPGYQPAPVQQPRQAAPNPGNPSRAPAQNGYQRQPQGKPHARAPRSNGAQQRGYQGQQRSH